MPTHHRFIRHIIGLKITLELKIEIVKSLRALFRVLPGEVLMVCCFNRTWSFVVRYITLSSVVL